MTLMDDVEDDRAVLMDEAAEAMGRVLGIDPRGDDEWVFEKGGWKHPDISGHLGATAGGTHLVQVAHGKNRIIRRHAELILFPRENKNWE